MFIISRKINYFLNFLKINNKVKFDKNSKNKILIDYFDDVLTIYSYSLVLDFLKKKYSSNAELFNFVPWFNYNNYFDFNFKKKITYLFKYFFGRIKFLNTLFISMNIQHGISYKNFTKHNKIAKKNAEKIFSKLNYKEDIYKIKIKNLRIGQYIYQTYLRNYSLPTVNIKDKKLLDVIYNALLIFFSIEEYFKKNKVKLVIVSHAFYIYYGIIAKYAATNGVKVIRISSTGWRKNTNFNISNITKNHIEEAPPYNEYKKTFSKLSSLDKKKKLKIGQKILQDRFKGQVQPHLLGHMSSYNKNYDKTFFLKKNRKSIIIFLNDFFDGPGRFKSAIFPDFYEWIIFTLDNAAKTNFDWYVKPHPRSQPGNDNIINLLKNKYKKYNNIYFLDKNFSNKKLINLNFKSVFMHHGNATAEFALKNFPVVNSCKGSMDNYNFFIKPKNKNQYLKMIFSADNLKIKIDKKEIYEWTYMNFYHYYNHSNNKKIIAKNFEFLCKKFHHNSSNNIRHKKVLDILIDTYKEKYKHNAINEIKKNLV